MQYFFKLFVFFQMSKMLEMKDAIARTVVACFISSRRKRHVYMKEACYIVFEGTIPIFHLQWIQKYCMRTEIVNSCNCSQRIWCLYYLAREKRSIFSESWMISNSQKIPNGILAAFTLTLLCSWGVGLERENSFCLLSVFI